jgi:hypothetical protein
VKDLSTHLLQAAGALDLLKVPEEPSAVAVRADHSADHLPEVAAFLAKTAMGAAVHSDAAVVGLARGASPVVVSPVAVRLEACPVVALAAAVAGFQVAVVVGAAEAANGIETVKLRRGSLDPLFLFLHAYFFLSRIDAITETSKIPATTLKAMLTGIL